MQHRLPQAHASHLQQRNVAQWTRRFASLLLTGEKTVIDSPGETRPVNPGLTSHCQRSRFDMKSNY
jgi:hypothetical protein